MLGEAERVEEGAAEIGHRLFENAPPRMVDKGLAPAGVPDLLHPLCDKIEGLYPARSAEFPRPLAPVRMRGYLSLLRGINNLRAGLASDAEIAERHALVCLDPGEPSVFQCGDDAATAGADTAECRFSLLLDVFFFFHHNSSEPCLSYFLSIC